MKLARYVGNGIVEIRDESPPELPPGGLLVRTEACGLCSGELMDWYMDGKIPHVLGHEVTGIIEESDDPRFLPGQRVFPHHHAPCMTCAFCRRRAFVHCPQWKRTRLLPGGMAEMFAVTSENLTDTFVVELEPREAALIEPLACVVKSLERAGFDFSSSGEAEEPEEEVVEEEASDDPPCAVIGLGVMGLMHLLLLPDGSVGFDTNSRRRDWAMGIGLDARSPEATQQFETVIICPGNEEALRFGLQIAAPDATLVLFSPMPPGGPTPVALHEAYFRDLRMISSYSCGPTDTRTAADLLAGGLVQSGQLVSDFIELNDLPGAYSSMKRGDIVKAMVEFS